MPDSARPLLLHVDVGRDVIDVLAGILREDHDLMVATNGRKALDLARGPRTPDLILLDVMLPDLDGFEVCRELQRDARTADVPIIFVTARDEVLDEEQGFEVGAVDYLTKPVNSAIVRARVRNHLALHDQAQHLKQLVRKRTLELESTRLRVIERLGKAAEFKDDETGKHVVRMAHYTRLVATHYGLPDDVVELLHLAAPLHDIGKIGIPDEILQKPGRFDVREAAIMQEHTTIGARIIGETEHALLATARELSLTHHERWDGAGYPYGIAGEDIPIGGRIAGIADVFDALTSVRPYKSAWPVERAVDLIESEAGGHFDPEVVEAFQRALPEILQQATLLNPVLVTAS